MSPERAQEVAAAETQPGDDVADDETCGGGSADPLATQYQPAHGYEEDEDLEGGEPEVGAASHVAEGAEESAAAMEYAGATDEMAVPLGRYAAGGDGASPEGAQDATSPSDERDAAASQEYEFDVGDGHGGLHGAAVWGDEDAPMAEADGAFAQTQVVEEAPDVDAVGTSEPTAGGVEERDGLAEGDGAQEGVDPSAPCIGQGPHAGSCPRRAAGRVKGHCRRRWSHRCRTAAATT